MTVNRPSDSAPPMRHRQPESTLVSDVRFRTQSAPERAAAARLPEVPAGCPHPGGLGGDRCVSAGDLAVPGTEKAAPRFGNTPTNGVHRALFHASGGASQGPLSLLAESVRLHDREPRRTCRDVPLCRSHTKFRGDGDRARIGACPVRQGDRSEGGNHGASARHFLRDHHRPGRSAGKDPFHRRDSLTISGRGRGSGEQ